MEPKKRTYNPQTDRKEYVARALEMHKAGAKLVDIANTLGVSRQTARHFLDEKAYQLALERGRRNDKKRRQEMFEGIERLKTGPRISMDVIEARLAEIPDDTRSKTARMFGDPLPGRSALDMRRAA